jgi:OPA family glycerol-3-phosphate transporter-like MFS transporter 1/2
MLSGQCRRYVVFAVSFMAMVARHAVLTSWSIVKQDVGDSLDFSVTELGAFETTYLCFYAVGNFICGALGDRFPLRVVVPCGIFVAAAAYGGVKLTQIVIMGFTGSGSLPGFFICWAVTGLAQATVWPGGVAVIGKWFTGEKRSAVMGFWSTNSLFGDILGQQFASLMFVIAGLPWPAVILLSTCILMSSGIFFALFITDPPSADPLLHQEIKLRKTGAPQSEVSSSPAEQGKQPISFLKAWALPG